MARKVINVNEEDYDFIREYCKENDLIISKWCVRVLLDKIKQENENGKKEEC
jgi:hypothetical protein